MSNKQLASLAADRHARKRALEGAKVEPSVQEETVNLPGYFLSDVACKGDKLCKSLTEQTDFPCDNGVLTSALIDPGYLSHHLKHLKIKNEFLVFPHMNSSQKVGHGQKVPTHIREEAYAEQFEELMEIQTGLSRQCSKITVHAPLMASQYGSQHAKLQVLYNKESTTRVIISTANHAENELQFKNQGHYCVDAPFQNAQELQKRQQWRSSLFGTGAYRRPCEAPAGVNLESSSLHPMVLSLQWNIAQVLECLEIPVVQEYIQEAFLDCLVLCQSNFHQQLQTFLNHIMGRSVEMRAFPLVGHDYTASLGCIVSAIPDRQYSKHGEHGIARIHQLICDARLSAVHYTYQRNAIAQSSSLGNMSIFSTLAAAFKRFDPTSVPKGALTTTDKPGYLQLIWPSVLDVATCVEGVQAGQWQPVFQGIPKNINVHQWKGKYNRQRYMPHIKTYHQPIDHNTTGKLMWSVLTSANNSIGAWGSFDQGISKLAHRQKEIEQAVGYDRSYHHSLHPYHFHTPPVSTGIDLSSHITPITVEGTRGIQRQRSLSKQNVTDRFIYLHSLFTSDEPEVRRNAVLDMLPVKPNISYNQAYAAKGLSHGTYAMNNYEMGVFFTPQHTGALFRAAYRGHFPVSYINNQLQLGNTLESHSYTAHDTTYQGKLAQWVQDFLTLHPTFPITDNSKKILPLLATPKIHVNLQQTPETATLNLGTIPTPSNAIHVNHYLPIPFDLYSDQYPAEPKPQQMAPWSMENYQTAVRNTPK